MLAHDHSSYQIYSSHISSIDRRAHIDCLAFGRRHRSGARVGGEAFAVDDGESPESVTMPDHNTFRCGDDGCSYWRSFCGWIRIPVSGGSCWRLVVLEDITAMDLSDGRLCFFGIEYNGMVQFGVHSAAAMVRR